MVAVAALATVAFVPPDAEYLAYFDVKVLSLLFCLMAVVQALAGRGALQARSRALLRRVRSPKALRLCLTLSPFFLSMLATNDVALLALVPLALAALAAAPVKERALTIVLQTIAANLGSMATPFGNPQNLYLYTAFDMEAGAFFGAVLPYSLISLAALVVAALLFPAPPLALAPQEREDFRWDGRVFIYMGLFILCALATFGLLPYALCLGLVLVTLMLTDRKALQKVDYYLLLTFVFFFLFAGNLRRIEAVREGLSHLMQGRELWLGLACSQVISNVPAAVTLAPFADSARGLLLGVNIGGLGTPVASLASLISYKLYAKSEGAKTGRYLVVFTLLNLAFLAVLLALAFLLRDI